MRAQWYSWFVILLISLVLSACDKSEQEQNQQQKNKDQVNDYLGDAESVAPDWDAHIADYPKRWIAAEAPMFIRFTHPVISEAEVNTAFNPKQISLDIKTPVNLTFTSTTDLRIQPIERLPGNTKIRVRLSANGLQGMENSLDDFEFEVSLGLNQVPSLRPELILSLRP